MSRRIEAVIFDWAGTTVDYGCFAPVEAFRRAFEEAGVDPTTDEIRAPMGLSKRRHVQVMFEMPRIARAWSEAHGAEWTDADADRVYRRSEELLLEMLGRYAGPIPHVLDAVDQLRRRGVRIGSTTGYSEAMMALVVPAAERAGYAPDCWVSADAVGGMGRPYPYMIFHALRALEVSGVRAAIKVGDTAADILEGKNAGLETVGLVEGSSLMGLSQKEYESLSPEQRERESGRVRRAYEECGADYVLQNMSELPALVGRLEQDI